MLPSSSYLCLFLSIYVVYHLTLLPSVPGGDSGELLGNACVMGISHPPGYPLFSLMANAAGNLPSFMPRIYLAANSLALVFDWNPTFAWRVNHMCCVLGALTVVLVAACTEQLLCTMQVAHSGHMAFIGAVLFAFSPLTWEYAAQSAEVFALNNFICASVVFFTCRVVALAGETPTTAEALSAQASAIIKYVYLGALFVGMAFANQHAAVLFIAVLIPAVLVVALPILHRRNRAKEVVLGSLAGFILGASPYAAQIWLARAYKARGSWGDLSSWAGIARHLFREEYGTFKMGQERENIEGFAERLWLYAKSCSEETNHAVYPLLAILVVTTSLQLFPAPSASEKQRPPLATPSSPAKPAEKSPSGGASGGGGSNSKKKKSRGGDYGSKDNFDAILAETPGSTSTPPPPGLGDGAPKSSNAATANAATGKFLLLSILVGTYMFYVLVWHGVLSNLPLSTPMPYIVHARFWIQPHILLCVLAGTGAVLAFSHLSKRVAAISANPNPIESSIVVVIFVALLRSRYSLMDRSKSGWIMHSYGEAILEALPQNSLLLSHTDLDWNPTRYLRECEGKRKDFYAENRPDVTHLNFQMIAYPWFKHQQAPLYPNTVFPRVDFRGISTDRFSEGNAVLVVNMLVGNGASTFGAASLADSDKHSANSFRNEAGHAFTGGIYLDMQAVNDVELEEGGKWRGLTLLPWGLLYRVLGPLDMQSMEPLHVAAVEQFTRLQKKMAPLAYGSDPLKDTEGKSQLIFRQFPPGSWEFAALSVYNDAQMQLGLNLLTWAIEVQKKADLNILPILLDRLHTSAHLLYAAHHTTATYHTISSSAADLHKNTAMAWMRLQGILGIALNFKDSLQKVVRTQPELMEHVLPHNADLLDALMTEEKYLQVLQQAYRVIGDFLAEHPGDKDRSAFELTMTQIVAATDKLQGKSAGEPVSKNPATEKAATEKPAARKPAASKASRKKNKRKAAN